MHDSLKGLEKPLKVIGWLLVLGLVTFIGLSVVQYFLSLLPSSGSISGSASTSVSWLNGLPLSVIGWSIAIAIVLIAVNFMLRRWQTTTGTAGEIVGSPLVKGLLLVALVVAIGWIVWELWKFLTFWIMQNFLIEPRASSLISSLVLLSAVPPILYLFEKTGLSMDITAVRKSASKLARIVAVLHIVIFFMAPNWFFNPLTGDAYAWTGKRDTATYFLIQDSVGQVPRSPVTGELLRELTSKEALARMSNPRKTAISALTKLGKEMRKLGSSFFGSANASIRGATTIVPKIEEGKHEVLPAGSVVKRIVSPHGVYFISGRVTFCEPNCVIGSMRTRDVSEHKRKHNGAPCWTSDTGENMMLEIHALTNVEIFARSAKSNKCGKAKRQTW
jgi:hypothetical protein